MNNLTVFTADYEGQSVRITPDGRVSVFDAIAAFRGTSCNPHQIWGDLQKNHPEVLHFTDNFQFPGRGQRPTPVTYEEGLYQILMLLPGAKAAEFRKWAAEILANYRRQRQEPVEQKPITPTMATLSEIDLLFAPLVGFGIRAELVQSVKLTAISKSIPHLTVAAEEAKRLLSSTLVVAEIPLSPTQLGEKIVEQLGLSKKISAQSVNEALQNAGLQVSQTSIDRHGKSKKTWQLTPEGEKYGQMQMDTAKGHNKTIFVPRWFVSVIPVIIQRFSE